MVGRLQIASVAGYKSKSVYVEVFSVMLPLGFSLYRGLIVCRPLYGICKFIYKDTALSIATRNKNTF